MYKIKVDLSGLSNSLKKEASSILLEVSNNAVKELEENTPVDTGAAAESWKMQLNPSGSATITNDKEYLKYLNAGSSKQAPANFIESIMLNYGKPKGPIVTYE